MAEDVGMDFCLLPEHHFDPGYSMMPDNMQLLAYIAGQTSRMKIGTGAIILPWWYNEPRPGSPSSIAMLDILLEGRRTWASVAAWPAWSTRPSAST